VKAIERTLEEVRVGKEKQKDRNKGINYTSSPLRYHVLYFHLDIYHSHFTPNIFNFNPFVSNHHAQIFTLGDLSDYKALYSRPINSAQAKATTKALASTDSIRLFKIPGKPPDSHSRNLPRNLLVPRYLLSGQIRKSENNLLFIFNYLDSSR
jgi:hypothetical protein